ncbi:hypothetical protein HanRHA438_Chr10g0451191 [Helianthus annuus]|nr:hypothetical protein HanIR_Chr10g0473301 [Helianthus annuus]KAJ0879414.1 hypothetical protein HanRHA438_Chr10g0451191 [Helianthus annuus]
MYNTHTAICNSGCQLQLPLSKEHFRHLQLRLPKQHLCHHFAIQLLSSPLTPSCNAGNSHHPFSDTTTTPTTTSSLWFCYIS